MNMKSKFNFIILLFLFLSLAPGFHLPAFSSQELKSSPQRSAAEIIEKLNENFSKIKDAAFDITLDYNLFLFGCSGLRRSQGHAYFKYPDKIKATLDKVTYFARGNRIRKIDEKGKRFYVRFINSLDFSPGFHPGLIPHNFNLSVVKDDKDGIVLQGTPKPGILKNVIAVNFHIDPQEYLLRRLDLILVNKNLSGKIDIDYKKIKGIWVPTGFHGTSAIELQNFSLVGLGISLKGENININNGLSDKLFNPGF